MFSPQTSHLDLTDRLQWGRLICSPLSLGTWSLLQPAGEQNHAPQLCWLDTNRLACVWMAGGGEGTAGMSIYLSVLKAGSRSWSAARRISQDRTRSEQNPLLFVTDAGRIQLIHTAQDVRDLTQPHVDLNSSFSMQWTAVLRQQSTGLNRMRWGRCQQVLEGFAFCRHPPYKRDDRKYLLPIYRSLEAGGAFGEDYSEVLLLDEDGSYTGECCRVPESTGRIHGTIVRSADGSSLLQFFRSRLADAIYRSVGSLDGQEWSVPEPIGLPNNNSSIQVCRLNSGRLAMAFNRFSLNSADTAQQVWGQAYWPRTRWPLTVALSDDDGNTWPWARDVDSGDGFCGDQNWHLNGQLAYPSLIEGQPGELHLAYSWGGRTAIRYVCLREHEITGSSAINL